MEKAFLIRRATEKDVIEITTLFYETIKTINKKDYNEEQIDVWASTSFNTEAWLQRIKEQYLIVALTNQQITGFSSLEPSGYLDFMFVHKDYQGVGIGKLLLQEIEKEANHLQPSKIFSEVSITARPFFEKLGFQVDSENKKILKGVEFINFKMSKTLK